MADRRQKSRFLLTGAFNTGVSYGLFALLYHLLSSRLHYLLIASLAYGLSVLCAHAMHRNFVFRHAGKWRASFLRYNITVSTIFVLGLGVLALLIEVFRLHPLLAQAIVLLLSIVASYFGHLLFSFRQK